MQDQLKACPFCDGLASITKADDDEGGRATFYVSCDVCECSMGDESYGDYHIGEGGNWGAYHSEWEALKAWNTRVK